MTTKPTGKDYVGSDDMYAEVQRTMRLVAEMNTGYHTEAEVRQYLSEITVSEVPDTVRVFTIEALPTPQTQNVVKTIKISSSS